MDKISIIGAKEHNLKNVDIEIPKNKLVVITGVSGSGKSSLAFDTIYAEGQRRYVESLSAYARQFLEVMQKPDVDSIEGLSPAISIEQKTTSKNPRSTVGTITEIYDYMRLLFARIGIPYSPKTGKPIESQSVSQIVDSILKKKTGEKYLVLAPFVRGRKGEYKKEILEMIKKGFQRFKIDGKLYKSDELPNLDKKFKHNIDVVVDRIEIKKDIKNQLTDSIETALNISNGIIYIENFSTKKVDVFSTKFACPVSGFTIEEIEPRLFSFNNPFGACPDCNGLGNKSYFDPEMVVPNENLSLAEGAIEPWNKTSNDFYQQTLQALSEGFNFSLEKPFKDLKEEIKKIILYGSNKKKITFEYSSFRGNYIIDRPFEGVIPNLQKKWFKNENEYYRDEVSKYLRYDTCESCGGFRLKDEALSVKIDKLHIGEVSAFTIENTIDWFKKLETKLNKTQFEIARRILKEINDRLNFLKNVGLNYLTLSRNSRTLSGGEGQRIRLASQIGSGLTGVLYVLDEPSIGLHQRDNKRLLKTLQKLKNLGNTIIVVEHDEEAIRTSDYIIDVGPGAGVYGGNIVAKGELSEILTSTESITSQYLNRYRYIPTPKERRKGKKNQNLIMKGINTNNLNNVNVKIPLGTFTAVTGVSGSGKSSLINESLLKAVGKKLNYQIQKPEKYKSLEGYEFIDKIVEINQAPIGRTPRSNPATYTGAFTPVREWFSNLPQARERGYKAGRFSFNVRGGRCETCQGDGVIKIEMHFLPDVYVKCDSCKGKRYNRDTLEIKFKDKNIADILDMTVDESLEFFKAIPNIKNKLHTLKKVGLGYIKIGQSATTLSGGEAQRIKLAKELSKRSTGQTLYILDEPTTGLHFEDVKKLLEVLHSLVDKGNTVIVIEHNLEVIKTADYIIDLGPEGGERGGKIIAEGTPEFLLVNFKDSYTSQYLYDVLRIEDKIKRKSLQK
ncbi:MAG: UvrABC system protein A [Alphaproteobacteria bacterium MarineAlpha6_Bin4]|nr:MAG: UvrABC system protein A [Alphaproteobacteria bacterium MarineAlpha6_Bin3]PPR37637.1 MAG: UvrABC system protein A [Alphaproteobacteria bacterium MarineAlpha6_Bin4]|tara:strand:- start:8828 stop:11689 length:2862 start_codon:yes stop_codon:yes gene_type:complete